MKEILIINLTRMGDLLQTTPLMEGLKEGYPRSRITILVNSDFTGICKGIRQIDNLIAFEMKDYQLSLKENRKSIVENYRLIDDLITGINEREYDLVINVTHSSISALMTSLVNAKEVRGFTIDSEGHRVIKHPWMRYFFNVIPTRKYNPYHLVDMYIKMGEKIPGEKGLFLDVAPEDYEKAEQILTDEGATGNEKLIGIHLGASKSDKMWPLSSYARLAQLIYQNKCGRIIVFGSKYDRKMADEFERFVDVPVLNLAGRTGLGELAAVLKRCSLFITNDTGPLHIATAVGTRVIDISTANVHFMETGPYGPGHYVIQAELPCVPCGFDVDCNDRRCKTVIRPDSVFEVVKMALGDDEIENIPDQDIWSDMQVYRSYYEDDGLLGYKPLIKRPVKKEVLYRLLYRQIWNMPANPSTEIIEGAFDTVVSELTESYIVDTSHEGLSLLINGKNSLEKITGLARSGMDICSDIAREACRKNPDPARIKKIWNQAEQIDNEIDLIGHANNSLMQLIIIHKFAKEAMEGDGIKPLAESLHDIYGDLVSSSTNLTRLINKLTDHLGAGEAGRSCEITTSA